MRGRGWSCIAEKGARSRCLVAAAVMAESSPGGAKPTVESPRNVRSKRDKVLSRYAGFKDAANERRARLEGARKFQQFRRDAQELESWVREKLQVVSDEAYKDRTNLQVRRGG